MINEKVYMYPWITVDGIDYSGKTALAENLATSINGIAIRPVPEELAQIRGIVDSVGNPQTRYSFYIACSFLTFNRIQGSLQFKSPVVIDRWVFSTTIHHKLLGVSEDILIPTGLLPRSPFMYFTTLSYETFLRRKALRNEPGIDDEVMNEEYMFKMNKFLREQGLIEIDTDKQTIQEAVGVILGDIRKRGY